MNSVNPVRIKGQKTAAFEIVDMLDDAPDIHVLPVGQRGNITPRTGRVPEYAADGIASRTPRMWGFQASGSAPIVRGEVVKDPHTIATAIRIGNPASWRVRRARPGRVRRLHRRSDRPSDPGRLPAAGLPGGRLRGARLGRLGGRSAQGRRRKGKVDPGQRIVCTVTGNGLKDPDWAVAGAPQPVTVPVDADAAAERLGLA
ncbi:Threonine synthase OS=Streptomyces rimosus subsp. rimosus (strain ATCC / DSM 40260 / JCM 4667/ NRRL 2234) OX=1265868 GN=SRIM_028055 PE=3 SV=1 [Streptomyces rimosus subsp. rimosus]